MKHMAARASRESVSVFWENVRGKAPDTWLAVCSISNDAADPSDFVSVTLADPLDGTEYDISSRPTLASNETPSTICKLQVLKSSSVIESKRTSSKIKDHSKNE
jgi:hypothetical protein